MSATATPRAGAGLPIAGTVRVTKAGAEWTIGHALTAPGITGATGRLVLAGRGDSTVLSGTTSVSSDDLATALGALARAGLDIDADIVSAVSGRASAEIGTRARPTRHGSRSRPQSDGVSYGRAASCRSRRSDSSSTAGT